MEGGREAGRRCLGGEGWMEGGREENVEEVVVVGQQQEDRDGQEEEEGREAGKVLGRRGRMASYS